MDRIIYLSNEKEADWRFGTKAAVYAIPQEGLDKHLVWEWLMQFTTGTVGIYDPNYGHVQHNIELWFELPDDQDKFIFQAKLCNWFKFGEVRILKTAAELAAHFGRTPLTLDEDDMRDSVGVYASKENDNE